VKSLGKLATASAYVKSSLGIKLAKTAKNQQPRKYGGSSGKKAARR